MRTISGNVYKKPFMTAGPAVGWVGETDARTQTTSPTLDELSFPAMELYAMPAATATLLEDAAVNIDQWLAQEVEQVFAAQEGTAFVTGDGSNKPKGFLSYTTVANGSWTWGNIGYIASGAAGAFAGVQPVRRAGRSRLRGEGRLPAERRVRDEPQDASQRSASSRTRPATISGSRRRSRAASASLMTFPVIEAEDMPDIAANSLSIAFGDFNRGYLVVDRAGVSVLRDPYTAKPYVLFYTTKRVGGGVQDFDAIKVMKFAAS